MATNNINKWENPENVKQKKDDSVELKFRKDFIYDTLKDKDSVARNRFIDDVMNSNDVVSAWDLRDLLESYQAKHQEKYWELDLDKINIKQLQNLLAKDFLKLSNLRNNLKETIFSDYEIDEKVFNLKVKKEVDKKNDVELKRLINSDKELTIFLNTILGGNINKREQFKVLNLSESEISKRLWKLSSEDKEQVEFILQRLNYSSKIKDNDLRFLFSTNFLKDEEKKELVSIFIPFANLSQLVNLSIISKDKAEEKKKDIVYSILKKEWINNDSLKKEFVDKLTLNDIEIETKDFLNNSENIDNIAQEIWFKNLENDLDDINEDLKEHIIENWPKNLQELVEWLKRIDKNWNRFSNLEKFREWNIIEFINKNSSWENEKFYLKILSNDENKKCFSYMAIWTQEGKIDQKASWKIEKKFYADFLEIFQKNNNLELDFLTKNELDEKIESWELESLWVDFLNENDLSNTTKKEQSKKRYKEYLWNEVSWLENEIEKVKLDINKLKDKKDLNKVKDLNTRLSLLESKKDSLLQELNGIDSISNDKLLWVSNFNLLLTRLDKIDSDWASVISKEWEKGLFKWMFLKTGDEKWFYEISWIDKVKCEIYLSNWEKLSFTSFLEAFEKHKTQRLLWLKDFSDLIKNWEEIKDNDLWKKWENHEFKDWKIIANWVEDWDDKNVSREVEYLVSDDNTIVKINNISWNKVKVQLWERKKISELSEKERKKWWYKKNELSWQYEWEILSIGKDEEIINLNKLEDYIKEKGLYPNWQTWKSVKKKSLENQNKVFGKKISSQIFSLTSVAEVLAWGKLFINSIEESLKKWNDLKSAKAALLMWKFLPEELKSELKIKVERAESEAMDNELDSLSKVDSRIAVKRIKSWLNNKSCPEFKKEAWLLFMLEKYWHLTAKEALYEYRWKYLWYEAFGWTVWDDFFNSIEQQAKDDNITFSEEYLMHILLKRQCKEKPFLWHKRRTRLHKEFEGKWAAWINDEVEKWYKDASNKRTATTMVDCWLGEATWGTTSNAIWWFKKAVERWWSLETMNEWFFCLLYSWALYDIDQKTFLNIKWLWDTWVPMITTAFSTKYNEMQLFNDTVLELSRRMQDIYWGDIYDEALKLYKDAHSKKSNEEKRLNNTQDFWKKHGRKLIKALSFAHTKEPSSAQTDKIILLEKDDNPIFKKYYDTYKEFMEAFNFSNSKDYLNDAAWIEWVSWLDVKSIAETYLRLNPTRQLADTTTWNNMWNAILKDINSVNKKQFYPWEIKNNDDRRKDRELKEKYLLTFMKELCSWFLSGASSEILKTYNAGSTDIWKFLNSIWLDLYRDLWEFSPTDVLETNKADNVILGAVRNILAWKSEWIPWNTPYDPFEVLEPVKDSTNSILNK